MFEDGVRQDMDDAPEQEDDDDVPRLIERTRTWRKTSRKPVDRKAGRRSKERRRLGSIGRRKADLDLSSQRRQFLLAYLRKLPEETLWLWIDGLWLALATEAQLAALAMSAKEPESNETETTGLPSGPQALGRPGTDRIIPGMNQAHDASMRFEWKGLTTQLKALSQARQKHHARMNGARNRTPRDLGFRNDCFESSIGQRVNQAGLFGTFFESTTLIPGEMAAMLLHRELRRRLKQTLNDAGDAVLRPGSELRRDTAASRATKAAELLKTMPAWRTMYNKLRPKPSPVAGRPARGIRVKH